MTKTALEVILTKIEGQFKPARALNPDIPPELDAVVTLLLAAHPDERYASWSAHDACPSKNAACRRCIAGFT